MTRLSVIRSLAAAACVAGLALTGMSLAAARPEAGRLRARALDLAQLQALAAARDGDLAAIRAYDALTSKTPPPLAEAAGAAGSGASMRFRESRPAADGWSVRTAEVSFESVTLSSLGSFMERVSAVDGAPPWRVKEISVTASDTAGTGRATVGLEALENAGAPK